MDDKHEGGDYTNWHLDQVEYDTDKGAPHGGADIKEGISLQHRIDTTYENDTEDFIEDQPANASQDLKRWRYPHRQ